MAGCLLINEMRVRIDGATQIMDRKGTPNDPGELKAKKRVYLEMDEGRARETCLPPRCINPGERPNFRFMK